MSGDLALFKYRCRQCGKVYTGSTSPADGTSSVPSATRLLSKAIVNDGPVALVCAHDCGDGKMGVTDLIGFERAKP